MFTSTTCKTLKKIPPIYIFSFICRNQIKYHTINMSNLLVFLAIFLNFAKLSLAGDGDNLFDTCPSEMDTTHRNAIFINGYPCKNPSNITASDFKSSLLNESGDTDNFYRSSMTMATALEFPGLNTLGLSTARTDIEVDGMVMPHAHPRASEMIFVRAGLLVAGFVDSNNQVFQKRLKEGDVFVFPKGLLHFCYNAGFENAIVFSVLNSQNPGLASITGAMFMSDGLDAKEVVMKKLKISGISV